MAIGFEYTLSVDEQSSLTELNKFIQAIGDLQVSLSLDLDYNNCMEAISKLQSEIRTLDTKMAIQINTFEIDETDLQAELYRKSRDLKLLLKVEFDDMALAQATHEVDSPTEKIKEKAERDVVLIQDSVKKMLNNLNAQMQKANISADIIDVKSIERSIEELSLSVMKFDDIKLRAREIKNEISGWQQAIKLQNNLLVETSTQAKEVRSAMKEANEAFAGDGGASQVKKSNDLYERRLNIQKESVKMSRQFKEASEDVRESLLAELNTMKISGNTIKELGQSYQEASIRIREMKSDLKAQHIAENGYAFNNLAESVKELASRYLTLEGAMEGARAVFSTINDYALELDNAYTDVAISMDITKQEFDGWVDTASEIARANGVTTGSIMEMVKIYAQAGQSLEDVQAKLQGTAAIQNITQWDADQTTAVVNSIINQFDLAGDATSKFAYDSGAAIEYFGDRLVLLSNNLGMDNVAAIQEMASAIDDAGSVIHNAGGSMEWYMAITGKLAETTNMTGSEIGAAMRMITARTLRQGEAVEAMGESADDMEFKMAKAEKALSDIGVTIRGETADELLSIEEILGKVAGAWDKLTDSQKQSVGEAMAGTQRSSVFQALMNEYQAIEELTTQAMGAGGELYEASEIRANNLEASYNKLKDTYNNLCRSIMDSDALQGLVETFDSLLQGLQTVIDSFKEMDITTEEIMTILTTLSGIVAGIKWNSISEAVTQLIALKNSGVLATTAINGLKGGLYGLIAAAIFTGLWNLCKAIKEIIPNADRARDSIKGLAEATQEYNDGMSGLDGAKIDVNSYVAAQQKMQGLAEDTQEYQEQLEISNQALSNLAQNYPDMASVLQNENIELDDKLLKIEQINEALQKEYELNMLNSLANDKDINALEQQIEEQLSLLDAYEQAKKNYQDGGSSIQRIGNSEFDMENNATNEYFDNIRKDIVYATNDLEIFNTTLKDLNESGLATERQMADLNERAVKMKDEEIAKQEELNAAKQEGANIEGGGTGVSQEEVDEITEGISQAQQKTAELNKTYATTIDQLREASDLSQQVADGFESMDLTNLLNSEVMDGFTGSIDNAADVTEHLKNKMQELQDKAYETSINMALQNEDTWNQIATQVANSLGVQEEDMATFINSIGDMREIDVENAQSAADAQQQAEMDMVRNGAMGYANFVNSKAGNRKVDMGNVAEFLNKQEVQEADTVEDLKRMWAAYYNAKADTIRSELGDLSSKISVMAGDYGDMGNVDPATMSKFHAIQKQMRELEATNDAMTNYFNNVSTTLDGASGALGQAVANASKAVNGAKNSGYKGKNASSKGGKGSSGKGSSGSTEKEVADLELAIDRYYQYNDAITDVENKLESLRAKREQITDRDKYKKSLQDEIDLINDQIDGYKNLLKEQKKEQSEIKKVLSNNGFKFDADGDITNYAKQLQTLQKKANKLSGDSKEAAIAQVKALADLIERYNELHDDIIPGTNLEMQDLKNTITGLNQELEEQTEIVDDLWDRYYNLSVQIAKVDHALNVNRKKQENAETDEERIKLIEEEINLLKQKQKLTQQNKNAAEQEAKTLQDQLDDYGVKFGSDGSIANYDQVMQALQNRINNSSGTEREEAEKAAETLADLVEKYTQLQSETIPGLEEEWLDYADAIGEAEESIEDIYKQQKEAAVDAQKDVADAYEYYLTKRYNKLKEALQKEQDAYNKAYEEETFDRTLNEQQQVLNEIAQQIAMYERDTSAAGRARLEQLKQEYAEQQAAINDIVRENEHEKANENFEDEAASLDEELAELLAPENLIKVVNDAIASGFITIGNEVMSLDVLMTNWMNETGDGLYVLGSVLKTELLDNLKNARDIVNELGLGGTGIDMNTGIASLLQLTNPGGANSQQASVTFSAPLLYVEGNVDQDVADQITAQLQQLEQQIYKNIANQLK